MGSLGKEGGGLGKEGGGGVLGKFNTEYWAYSQTGLGLYIRNMLKSIKGASKALEARLELAGHADFFPSAAAGSVPVAATKEWDLLQTFDHRTLLCTVVRRGSGTAWRTAVADITAEVDDMQQLISQPRKC